MLRHNHNQPTPNQPQELGTYCGYSTILLAAHLKDPAARVYTIDICPENVDIAKQMIAHAGQSSKVVHVVKPLDEAVAVRVCPGCLERGLCRPCMLASVLRGSGCPASRALPCPSHTPPPRRTQELRAALKAQGADCFDLVFIDHEKSVYLSDLQLLVKEGLIK
jgi:hypothetical protein